MKINYLSAKLLGFFGLSLGLAGQLYAQGGDLNLIHSCVNNSSGEIKIIALNGTCHNNQTSLDWYKGVRTTPGTFNVNCNAGQTINDAVEDLISGDTLLVSGACNENVVVGVGGVTLNGQESAKINGPDTTMGQATVRILGRNVIINGFTITGGRDGIQVIRGGTATISGNNITGTGTVASRDGIVISRGGEAAVDGNTVQNWGRFGINLDQNGTAYIINNIIHNNLSDGVLVEESSSARIGFKTFFDTEPGTNTIQNNGRYGVHVNRSSTAIILGNTISNNASHGVIVMMASHADVGANVIDANGTTAKPQDGIFVSGNSGVDLGQTAVPFDRPNSGTNTRNGIRCWLGAYVNIGGNLGALTGSAGATNFSGDCPVNP